MFDSDSASFFLGDEASLQKKEAELAKRLVFLFTNYLTYCFDYISLDSTCVEIAISHEALYSSHRSFFSWYADVFLLVYFIY